MKPRIFKDIRDQELFDRDGYVVIDFISPVEATVIADKFYELHPVVPKGFYSNAYNPDDKIRQDILSHTDKIINRALFNKFQDYKKLGSTFLCKAPGEESKLGVHQDWSVVDETTYYSATIWVPTVDVNEENGALRIIPGSHLFFNTYRSPNIDFCYRGNEELLWENMITVPMRAGQAFVLNHAVIHGSASNKTNKERIAIAYGLVPRDARLMFYHKDKNNKRSKLEKFEMPDDFFQRYYNVGERPLFGNLVETLDYPIPFVSGTKIRQLVESEKWQRKTLSSYLGEWAKKDFADNKIVNDRLELYAEVDGKGFSKKYYIFNILRELREWLFKKSSGSQIL